MIPRVRANELQVGQKFYNPAIGWNPDNGYYEVENVVQAPPWVLVQVTAPQTGWEYIFKFDGDRELELLSDPRDTVE